MKRKAREHKEAEPENKATEETKEESQEVVEEVRDQSLNEEAKSEAAVIEAAVINTTAAAEPKDPPSEEALEEKQTTEGTLDAATSTVTAETEKVPAAAEYTQEQIAEQEILKNVARIFQTSKMEYLQYEELMDSGGHTLELSDEHRVETESQSNYGSYGSPIAFATSRQNTKNSREYWKSNAPVLVKVDYNEESLMLPKLAPRDEPQVTIRNVTYERSFETIKNHQGGSIKVNWHWKTQLFNNHFMEVAPALYVTAKNMLTALRDYMTLNVYILSDITLYGNTLGTELAIEDRANLLEVLPAT